MLGVKYITKLQKYQKFSKENSVYKIRNTIVCDKILTFFSFYQLSFYIAFLLSHFQKITVVYF